MEKINEIVSKAIPITESCPVKVANAKWRREVLRKEIEKLIHEAKAEKPFAPVTNYK